jgi:hypothetical protein
VHEFEPYGLNWYWFQGNGTIRGKGGKVLEFSGFDVLPFSEVALENVKVRERLYLRGSTLYLDVNSVINSLELVYDEQMPSLKVSPGLKRLPSVVVINFSRIDFAELQGRRFELISGLGTQCQSWFSRMTKYLDFFNLSCEDESLYVSWKEPTNAMDFFLGWNLSQEWLFYNHESSRYGFLGNATIKGTSGPLVTTTMGLLQPSYIIGEDLDIKIDLEINGSTLKVNQVDVTFSPLWISMWPVLNLMPVLDFRDSEPGRVSSSISLTVSLTGLDLSLPQTRELDHHLVLGLGPDVCKAWVSRVVWSQRSLFDVKCVDAEEGRSDIVVQARQGAPWPDLPTSTPAPTTHAMSAPETTPIPSVSPQDAPIPTMTVTPMASMTATLVGTLLTSSTDPFTPGTTPHDTPMPTATPEPNSGLSTWAIAGISAAGALWFLGAVVVVIWCLRCRVQGREGLAGRSMITVDGPEGA